MKKWKKTNKNKDLLFFIYFLVFDQSQTQNLFIHLCLTAGRLSAGMPAEERPREEGMRSAGTPPLPLQSWELSPPLSAASSLALTSKTGAESPCSPLPQFIFRHIATFQGHTLQPSILFRRETLERPRLEWGTETMNTISCSKVNGRRWGGRGKKPRWLHFPLYTGYNGRRGAVKMPINLTPRHILRGKYPLLLRKQADGCFFLLSLWH